jgi:hypothetical protein
VSDDVLTVVEISIGPLEAIERAEHVVRWLLDADVVVPNPERDKIWQPSALRAGPAVRRAAPEWQPAYAGLANNGVDVLAERALYHPMAAYAPPPCPVCGHQLDEDTHDALVAPWLAGTEPPVTCPHCGAVHPLGDWPGTFQVGELAVRFNNWPPVVPSFLDELGARLGPRWRVVHERY